jgi:hypothetical protein
MEYIIVWRSHHRDPHLDVDSHYFLERYSSYEDAQASAEQISGSDGYHDYEIFQTAND